MKSNNTIKPKDKRDIFVLEDISILDERVFSEQKLKNIAIELKNRADRDEKLYDLIHKLSSCSKNYDWNVGSLLQHFCSERIVTTLKKFENISILNNSIGLSWVLGELKCKDPLIVDFLYSVVNYSTSSDAWWRAAFSLENLGVEEAVNLLKRSLKVDSLLELKHYLKNIRDKRSLISILILSNVDNIQNEIYPKIKSLFINSDDTRVLINCCWLIGRLNLVDKEIFTKLVKLIKNDNYELKYYTFFALQSSDIIGLKPFLLSALKEKDPLIRKMACRALKYIGDESSMDFLLDKLNLETDESVISEISKTLYFIKNPISKNKLRLEINSHKNENGLIIDESDKWYKDSAIYNTFSEAEDPENICFDIINSHIKKYQIENPIDLATGTGRTLRQILEKIDFKGSAFAVDISKNMCEFVEKNVKRERKYVKNIKIINSSIVDLPKHSEAKSNFIISSFGFPSKISNSLQCIEELKSVYKMLSKNGLFLTIGWDETFNDELNLMWFKYVPDSIKAKNFEDWRQKRAGAIKSPRNCNLSWLKKGISVPLQFSSLKEASSVMGYLFGRDAAQNIIATNKTEWLMSMGITLNTKEEIYNIIKGYEKRN